MATYAKVTKQNVEVQQNLTEFVPKDTIIFNVHEIMEVTRKKYH